MARKSSFKVSRGTSGTGQQKTPTPTPSAAASQKTSESLDEDQNSKLLGYSWIRLAGLVPVIVGCIAITFTYYNEIPFLVNLMQPSYHKSSITNEYDLKIATLLDDLDSYLNTSYAAVALDKADDILEKYSRSPRAMFAKAEALNLLSGAQNSNELLEEAIDCYQKVAKSLSVPPVLERMAVTKVFDRMQFRGWDNEAVVFLRDVVARHPKDTSYLNDLGIALLLTGDDSSAKSIFQSVLNMNSRDSVALLHLGFIAKTLEKDNLVGARLLEQGLLSGDPASVHPRFYYHLGDSLLKIGQPKKAYNIHQLGAKHGIFLSPWQRSIYNCLNLTAQPWWTAEKAKQRELVRLLEDKWRAIQEEAMLLVDTKTGNFLPEDEDLLQAGDWKQLPIYERGKKSKAACQKLVTTCSIVDQFPTVSNCRRGQVKLSILHSGTKVWPHCGPTNCRLRAHLPLVVPKVEQNSDKKMGIRVGNETRIWQEGKVIIFDDSFEHEVWYSYSSYRMVLIVDFWHPEVTEYDKRTLPPV